jgi:hypothetical protein
LRDLLRGFKKNIPPLLVYRNRRNDSRGRGGRGGRDDDLDLTWQQEPQFISDCFFDLSDTCFLKFLGFEFYVFSLLLLGPFFIIFIELHIFPVSGKIFYQRKNKKDKKNRKKGHPDNPHMFLVYQKPRGED